MNRDDLQRIAQMRLTKAEELYNAGHFCGAYYLMGYAIECAFKAAISKQIKEYDFPDKKLVNACTSKPDGVYQWVKDMVTQTFNQEMVDAGVSLLQNLDSQDLNVTAALWFYLESSDTWRLIIASPRVESAGPKRVYERIQKVLGSDADASPIRLRDVSVVPPDDPLIKLLGITIKTGTKDISDIRFSRSTINGQFIQDAYIYRLP